MCCTCTQVSNNNNDKEEEDGEGSDSDSGVRKRSKSSVSRTDPLSRLNKSHDSFETIKQRIDFSEDGGITATEPKAATPTEEITDGDDPNQEINNSVTII